MTRLADAASDTPLDVERARDLRRMKVFATGLLLAVTALFVAARLADFRSVEIDFEGPLAPAWQIDRPAALRRAFDLFKRVQRGVPVRQAVCQGVPSAGTRRPGGRSAQSRTAKS